MGWTSVLLHHGTVDPNAPWWQRAIDSDAGIVAAIFMHTFGALLFTAGIALYIYQARIINQARELGTSPSLRFLPLAHVLNIGGIGVNGAGGLMRLFESDHPGLELLGTSLWVQMIFVKHLFLVAGVGVAALLTLWTFQLARRKEAPANFFPQTGRMTNAALVSFVSILAASALGAVAANVNLAEDMGTNATASGTDRPTVPLPVSQEIRYANASGRITGTPVQPGRATSPLPAPDGASEVWAELTWTNTQRATLDASLVDPSGKAVQATRQASAGRVQVSFTGSITPGTWQIVVTTTSAVDEPYHVIGRTTVGDVPNSVEETYTVNPKAQFGIVELNLRIKLGQSFNYSWEVLDSTTAMLDFNIHTHPPGAPVEYPVRGTWNKYSGRYVHNDTRTDGASLMWENPGNTPIKVHFRVEGTFTVDSRFIR